jgi:hypothetical protein
MHECFRAQFMQRGKLNFCGGVALRWQGEVHGSAVTEQLGTERSRRTTIATGGVVWRPVPRRGEAFCNQDYVQQRRCSAGEVRLFHIMFYFTYLTEYLTNKK